jgi:hypothetical protein
MNSDEGIARLGRVSKLFARAGRRERKRVRTVEEKVLTAEKRIDIIIDFQIATEERFAQNEERFAQLAEAQTQTQKRLDALIQAIERDRNGHSS